MNYQQLIKNEEQDYINRMRPVINIKALFSDMTESYVSPCEPEPDQQVSIRFRTKKNNVDSVYLVCAAYKTKMHIKSTDEMFDYFETKVFVGKTKFTYCFEIRVGRLVYYYDKRGAHKETLEHYQFALLPGFKTPDWSKGAVMYQIFVDRFYNGDPTNDVLTGEYNYIGGNTVKVYNWNKYPDKFGIREFYGGDLQGVLDKLDYLQSLGIDVIYFNPLFVSPSNHKYDIQDYDYIDPHYGKIIKDGGTLLNPEKSDNREATRYIRRVTDKVNLEASNRFFAEVVKEIHKRGMKVILDGVFNHCGSFNKWLDREQIYSSEEGYQKGAFVDSASPYRGFFKFHDETKWPNNHTYDGWWGHDTLPKLNYEGSKELYEYILSVAAKWVSAPFHVDGWRLDVAADLGFSPEMNHKFWKDFRKAVKKANPEALILAEHYGDPSSWLHGDEWDSVMNYDAFMEPITWFLTGMQKHSDDYREDLHGNAGVFWDTMRHNMASFAMPSLFTAMNELSNHDHSRFLTRTNKKVGRIDTLGPDAANQNIRKEVFREAVVMQMTWPGSPTIYYGDEAGLCGFTDPDNRRAYPWGEEDLELISLHKEMIKIHKNHYELRNGSIKELYGDDNIIAYGRFTSEEQSIIIVNNSEEEQQLEIPVWLTGMPRECTLEQLIITGKDGHSTQWRSYPVLEGILSISMSPVSSIILKHKKINRKKFLHFA